MWKVKKSNIHNSGVFATEDIKKGTRIIEYIGKKVTKAQGDKISEKRLNKYLHSKKEGSVYIFELNKKYDIDGLVNNNKARFINHSCNPNCEVFGEGLKIWIYAMKNIKKGEELSYDYGFSFDENFREFPCNCQSKNCVGFIVREGSRWRIQNAKAKRKS